MKNHLRPALLFVGLLVLIASACLPDETAAPSIPMTSTASPASPAQTAAETPSTPSLAPMTGTPTLPTPLHVTPPAIEATSVALTLAAPTPTGVSARPLVIDGLQAIRLINNPQPEPSFFALTASGLYITRDGGLTWTLVTPDPLFDEFAFSSAEPATLYAGAGADCFRGGPDQPLYKSINGGATWNELPAGINLHPVAVHPNDSEQVWAVGCSGPAYSADGGETWSVKSNDLFLIYNVSELVPAPSDWSVVFAAGVSEGGSGAIAVSTDVGENWTSLLTETPQRPFWWVSDLLVLSAETQRLFAVDPHGLWRSLDAGANWEFFSAGLEPVVYQDGADFSAIGLNALAIDGATTPWTLYMGTARGVYQSRDMGERWEKIQGVSWEDTPIRDVHLFPALSQREGIQGLSALFVTTEDGVHLFEP